MGGEGSSSGRSEAGLILSTHCAWLQAERALMVIFRKKNMNKIGVTQNSVALSSPVLVHVLSSSAEN